MQSSKGQNNKLAKKRLTPLCEGSPPEPHKMSHKPDTPVRGSPNPNFEQRLS